MGQTDVAEDQVMAVKVACGETQCACECRPLVSRTTWILAGLLFAGAGGYVAYQRAGTTANVDVVERSKNLAGGFVALGRTESEPGFLLLSALDEGKVEVNAAQVTNWAAGTYVVVKIATAQGAWKKRLRGPLAIVVDEDGMVAATEVDWSAAELDRLRAAMDCSGPGATRCGAPFADLREALTEWPAQRIPQPTQRFLDHHGRLTEHIH